MKQVSSNGDDNLRLQTARRKWRMFRLQGAVACILAISRVAKQFRLALSFQNVKACDRKHSALLQLHFVSLPFCVLWHSLLKFLSQAAYHLVLLAFARLYCNTARVCLTLKLLRPPIAGYLCPFKPAPAHHIELRQLATGHKGMRLTSSSLFGGIWNPKLRQTCQTVWIYAGYNSKGPFRIPLGEPNLRQGSSFLKALKLLETLSEDSVLLQTFKCCRSALWKTLLWQKPGLWQENVLGARPLFSFLWKYVICSQEGFT